MRDYKNVRYEREHDNNLLELVCALAGISMIGAILLTAPTWGAWIDRLMVCQ